MQLLKRFILTLLFVPVSILDILINGVAYFITGDISKYSIIEDFTNLLKKND